MLGGPHEMACPAGFGPRPVVWPPLIYIDGEWMPFLTIITFKNLFLNKIE